MSFGRAAEPPAYTDAEILDGFLCVPDDEWPDTLSEHPSLAAVIRAEVERLLREREQMIVVLRQAERFLDRVER